MKWYQLGSQVLGAFLFYLLAILTFLDIFLIFHSIKFDRTHKCQP